MGKVRNILFIMADQLRADYLSCYGHPHLETPNLDGLARKGVRFDRAYIQSPVCGPSRMSFYTGRTAFSHGATWNFVPLPVGEVTLGDHLSAHGIRTALVGKTHMMPDIEGMERVGLSPDSARGLDISQCGFEPYERDDGEHPHPKVDPDLAYNRYLRERGYDVPNPWNDYANAAEGPDGEVLEGWYMSNAPLAARVAEEHSETAYMTDRALQFLDEQGDAPWCLHLSYIKPHWPYIAPAPYHAMYGHNQVLPAVRDERERADPHPVYGAIMNHKAGRAFSRQEVRDCGNPRLYGVDQADRRPSRPGLPVSRGDRADGRHDDRLHLRPRRLPGRPLAGRKGVLPRTVGARSDDRLRPRPKCRLDTRKCRQPVHRRHRPRADFPGGVRNRHSRPHRRGPVGIVAAAGRHGRSPRSCL